MSNIIWIVIAFIIYSSVMIYIGAFFFKKSQNLSDYFLGGRNLNSWVAALSAQASDMSGWLLMGLPGAVYAAGTGKSWIAVGLAIGTALNWIFVAKRLRRYTIVANNAITIPEYLENRFHDSSRILRISSAIVITLFFAVYTASGFVACGTLFSQVFNLDYQLSLFVGTGLILIYTFLGGFAAVCWTDLIQGILMLIAIVAVPILALISVGGLSEVAAQIPPDFLNLMSDGNGGALTITAIISDLAWGLGYFGMPHILVRFMAIKSEKEVNKSAIIAIVWVVLSLSFSVAVGLFGLVCFSALDNPETVFIRMIQRIFLEPGSIVPVPLFGGFFLCGILAAIMSTADSQLLVTSSAITGDIYRGINKQATDKNLVWVSRIAVCTIAVIAYIIARNPNSSIMDLVANAWSGFGSAFGSLVLLSLYWKRVNRPGAVAGIISGGLTVLVWDYIPMVRTADGALQNIGQYTGLYSLVPGFAVSFILIVGVSLITKVPSEEMLKEFEDAHAVDINREI